MEELIKERLKALGINAKVDVTNAYVEVRQRRTTLFKCSYDQYPACCGIVLLYDFEWSYDSNNATATEIVIQEFIKEMAKDPDSDGPDISGGPYGSIIISDTTEWFRDLLVEMKFKLVNTFENPKTEKTIFTLIYKA